MGGRRGGRAGARRTRRQPGRTGWPAGHDGRPDAAEPGRRMVGAWCFVDHYGPDDIADEPGMQVPPHPHMGLQTVTLAARGRGAAPRQRRQRADSSGPGQLNLMTAGPGIAHSEQSRRDRTPLAARRPAVGRPAGRATGDIDARTSSTTPTCPWSPTPAATRHGAPRRPRRRRLAGATYTPLVGRRRRARPGRRRTRCRWSPTSSTRVLTMAGEVAGRRRAARPRHAALPRLRTRPDLPLRAAAGAAAAAARRRAVRGGASSCGGTSSAATTTTSPGSRGLDAG